MLRVLGIVYLLSLANGLFLVALDRTFGFRSRPCGVPAELPAVELAGSEGLSTLLLARRRRPVRIKIP